MVRHLHTVAHVAWELSSSQWELLGSYKESRQSRHCPCLNLPAGLSKYAMSSISVGHVAQVLLPTTSSLELNAQQGAPWSLLDKLQTNSQHLETWDPRTLLAAESIVQPRS